MNDFSIKNLIFQDKEIEIIDINQSKNNDQDKITITFKSINPNHPEYCQKCGCVNFGSKDYYIRKIKHLNLSNDIECELLFKQKWFKCLECNIEYDGNKQIKSLNEYEYPRFEFKENNNGQLSSINLNLSATVSNNLVKYEYYDNILILDNNEKEIIKYNINEFSDLDKFLNKNIKN